MGAETRIAQRERAMMRAETLACFWPSRATGLAAPAWRDIADNLQAVIDEETLYFAARGRNYDRLLTLRALQVKARDKALFG